MKNQPVIQAGASLDGDRRRFLRRIAGLGLVLWSSQSEAVVAPESEERGFEPLGEDSSFPVGDRGEEIIRQAYDIGREYERVHKGCARCTVAALQNAVDFIPADNGLFRAASALGGGATAGEGNCGSFTGSALIIGWICGAGRFEDGTELTAKLVRQVYDRYKEEYGSVLCKDLKKKMDNDCPEIVGRAASWTAEILLRQFSDFRRD